MNVDPGDVRTKLDAGRKVIADRLRALADDLEHLPVEGTADLLCWGGDDIEKLLREATG